MTMTKDRKNILLIFAGVIVCIIVFGIFVYPGAYKYDKLDQSFPVKINRFTGYTQIMTYDGWQELGNVQSVETQTTPAN